MKRLLDIVLAGLGLLILSPVLFASAIAVKLDSRGPVLFQHTRVGRGFQPIRVYKFRTMNWPPRGPDLTTSMDNRVTRTGRVLRNTKIDELPQLINVVIGDMSLVGPRPEVPRYVAVFRKEYEDILTVRPGITGPAAVKYRNESALLDAAADPEALYLSTILPDKIALDRAYVQDRSLLFDFRLLVRTVWSVISGPSETH
jgi:lipopolysaccharide/colanic/teichoic acid biosynthesis glycosyltransferase